MKPKISALHRKSFLCEFFFRRIFEPNLKDATYSNDTLCVNYDHIGVLDDLPQMRVARLRLAG
jgi:hypothetical protein